MTYFYLILAIIAEVIATSALKASEQFTHFWPSLIVIVGYAVAFYFLSLTLRYLPVGITYAIWSGVGVVLIAIIGAIVYQQIPDWPAILGMLLIVSGVATIHLFSNSVNH